MHYLLVAWKKNGSKETLDVLRPTLDAKFCLPLTTCVAMAGGASPPPIPRLKTMHKSETLHEQTHLL